ncbi:hypothetical protein IJG11_01140 [Candidatus Saccharibacteria bacterium]|nr:hypothetical protein [Candidatus Saccharibacteria bacterium]MBR0415606.1 hypothetical protein [Candidatus Saccharibacteria bacterium]
MTVENLNRFFGLRFSGVKCPSCGNFIEFDNGEKLGDLFSDSVYLDIYCNDCGCAMEFNGYGLLNEFSCQIDIPGAAESVGKISLTDLNLNYEAEELQFSSRAEILTHYNLPSYFEDHSDIDWHSDMADFDVVFKIPNLEAFRVFKPAQNESKTEDNTQETPKLMSQTNNERTCVNLKNKINLFGTTMEFGPNNDSNLVCTMLGVAVKTDDGSLHVYDKKKKKIINTGDMKLGDFPIFLMPDTKVKVGEMIKRDDGKYCFVEEVCADGRIKAIAPKESEVHTLVPVENLLGWKLYTKVVCLLDGFTGDNGVKGLFGDGDGIGKMLMVAAMMSGGFSNNPTRNDTVQNNTYFEEGAKPLEDDLPFDMQSLMPFLLLSESGLFGEGLNFSGESTPFKSDLRQLLLLSSMMNPAGEGLNFLGGGSSPLGLLLMMKIMSKDREHTADADSTTGGEHGYNSGKGIQLLNPSGSAAEEHREEPGESPGNDSDET